MFSSIALAQVDSTTIRYAGDADGGWSGSGADIPGPQDGACANMGAVNKENQAFAFGFTLPNDATIEAMSAEIFATTNDAPNQPIGVQLATGASTDPATGLLGAQQQLIVPQTGANCASATPLSFPSDGMGGEEADWGIPLNGWPTVAQVNAAAFGLVFTKLQTSSIKVDSVCLEIFYTTPAGPAVQEDCFADGATLTLLKDVVQDNGGNNPDTDWTLTATGPTPGVTGVEGDAAITNATVDAGDYTLTESSVPGYNQTNLSCVGGTLVNNVLTLADGNVAECTFTNDDVAPTVTLIKNVTNDNGGDAGVNDFGLTIGGVGVNSGVATPVDANTPIALDEAGLSGYAFVSITGDAGCPANLGGTVTLDEGASITCTINNDDIAPTITLSKNVTNDNGGDAGVNDFGLTVGGAGVNSGDITPVDANTPIALDEAGLSGYAFVSITGDA
ncbi:MAG: hypothetical protein HKN15_13240, partial [Xanthomonadales bacterium]|nr:hypothetical protein [Xanthomonadales bacterium]